MTVYIQGDTLEFVTTQAFTSIGGTPVDPDEVIFGFSVNGQAPVSWTYVNGTGDPTHTIVRDGVGLYHANIDTTTYPAGTWVYTWVGNATTLNHDVTRTQVRAEAEITVSPPTVAV